MFEPRICYHRRSRKIYNEGFCGEFKTYTLPARTIKMSGSTLNLNEGCNRCRAKFLKGITRGHKRQPNFKPYQLPMDAFIRTVRTGSHREWIETRPKHGFHRIVNDYTTMYNNCLPGKEWLKEHENDINKFPEPTIELSVNGRSIASINGDYKRGMISDTLKPYTTKVRVGRKSINIPVGEADRISPVKIIKEEKGEKMNQQAEITKRLAELTGEKKSRKPNNQKRRQILDFARDNNMVIHPSVGFDYYVNNFYEAGHCPCDKDRPDCPCPESINEVKENGRCKCCLFWRDLDTFKESHIKG